MEGYSVQSVISSLLLNILNIAALYLILRALVYRPVKKFLVARQDRIQAETDHAAAMRTDAEALHQRYVDELLRAEDDAEKRTREILGKAEDASRAMKEQAERDGEAMLRHAQEALERNRDDALQQLRREAADIVVDIASRVLEREVSPADNGAIVSAYFDELERAQKGGHS